MAYSLLLNSLMLRYVFWSIQFYFILFFHVQACFSFLLYLFFLLILLYIHVLVYSIVIYPVDSILYYRYVGLFTSVQIYSVLFIYILLTLISLYRVELCWSSLFISILFYILHSVMFFLSTLCFGSILLYIMSWIIHFYSILSCSILLILFLQLCIDLFTSVLFCLVTFF